MSYHSRSQPGQFVLLGEPWFDDRPIWNGGELGPSTSTARKRGRSGSRAEPRARRRQNPIDPRVHSLANKLVRKGTIEMVLESNSPNQEIVSIQLFERDERWIRNLQNIVNHIRKCESVGPLEDVINDAFDDDSLVDIFPEQMEEKISYILDKTGLIEFCEPYEIDIETDVIVKFSICCTDAREQLGQRFEKTCEYVMLIEAYVNLLIWFVKGVANFAAAHHNGRQDIQNQDIIADSVHEFIYNDCQYFSEAERMQRYSDIEFLYQ